MNSVLPSALPGNAVRRHSTTFKLLFVAGMVLLLHLPLLFINKLRQERMEYRGVTQEMLAVSAAKDEAKDVAVETPAVHGYRMVERALKHSVLVLALVFAAFFLFETLAGLRLHAVHYALVGAALCLFYLALLALGEVLQPGWAYVGAAVGSSLLIVCYSVSILRSVARAGSIAALLAGEHSVLFVVLRMEDYALLAGTGALFVALGAVMFFTRKVDWFAQEGTVGA